jgi:hypothetical protein
MGTPEIRLSVKLTRQCAAGSGTKVFVDDVVVKVARQRGEGRASTSGVFFERRSTALEMPLSAVFTAGVVERACWKTRCSKAPNSGPTWRFLARSVCQKSPRG